MLELGWTPQEPYKVGDVIFFSNGEKGVVLEITSDNIQHYPLWIMPTCPSDAYQIGDLVEHDGKLYKSLYVHNRAIPGNDNGLFWECLGEAP